MAASMIDRQKISAAFVVFSTVFDMKLKNTPTIYQEIATVIPGVSEQVQFKWLSSIPVMRRWMGDRSMQRLRAETQTLLTDWWANGIEVDVDDLNNEAKFGMIVKRVRSMAQAAARRMDAQVIAYYTAGFAGTLGVTYDNQYLYDTDHTAAGNGQGVQQTNIVTGAFASTPFNTGLQQAMEIVDDEGEPVGVQMTTVLGGPSNQLAFRQVFKQEYQSGSTNIDAGMAKPLISPRIVGSAALNWFMLSDEEIRSVILGIEVAPEFAASDKPESYEMFNRRNALYGAHTKFGCCYGLWQSSMGSTG